MLVNKCIRISKEIALLRRARRPLVGGRQDISEAVELLRARVSVVSEVVLQVVGAVCDLRVCTNDTVADRGFTSSPYQACLSAPSQRAYWSEKQEQVQRY